MRAAARLVGSLLFALSGCAAPPAAGLVPEAHLRWAAPARPEPPAAPAPPAPLDEQALLERDWPPPCLPRLPRRPQAAQPSLIRNLAVPMKNELPIPSGTMFPGVSGAPSTATGSGPSWLIHSPPARR